MKAVWKSLQVVIWVFALTVAYAKMSNGQSLIVEHPFAFEPSSRGGASEGWAGK